MGIKFTVEQNKSIGELEELFGNMSDEEFLYMIGNENEFINFSDWFNPYLREHIDAYVYLSEHKHWEEGFIPDNVIMDNMWQIFIVNRMSTCWITYMTGKEL